MNVAVVASTALSTVAYDDAAGILQLEFRSGAVYRYFDVPAEIQQGLLRAASKGRYFNEQIREHFRQVFVATAGKA